ncbi:hypothetical protein [Flavobacterium defluvii]|uniref:hypothetical protein n=1 Tax=Flavobacterium defluvii TaxID=370979 RepID=UPI0009323CAD|nr:hypothetical protein [Flavobacterium defluvii]
MKRINYINEKILHPQRIEEIIIKTLDVLFKYPAFLNFKKIITAIPDAIISILVKKKALAINLGNKLR